MIHWITSAFGAILALFSLMMAFAAFGDLVYPQGTDTSMGVIVGICVFFVLTTAGGAFLFYHGIRQGRRRRMERNERTILKIIAEKEGRLTPEEVALETEITVEEAKTQLDGLCEKGAGEVQVTQDGRLLYVFFGFMDGVQKASAQNPLDV